MPPRMGWPRIAMGVCLGIPKRKRSLRFSPAYPHMVPSFSKIDDILDNAPRRFWALRLEHPLIFKCDGCQVRVAILLDEAAI